MEPTITTEAGLAKGNGQQAADNGRPEEMAPGAIARAVRERAIALGWPEKSKRRGELLGKLYDTGLTDAEEAELAGLDALADEVVRPADEAILAHARKMLEQAKALANAPKP